jgi:acetaldehyde dehydrogenase/alcohol dehydrogenase
LKIVVEVGYIWNSIKHDKTVGVIGEDKQKGLIEVAGPVGVVCGVTPTTNPTSTTIWIQFSGAPAAIAASRTIRAASAEHF